MTGVPADVRWTLLSALGAMREIVAECETNLGAVERTAALHAVQKAEEWLLLQRTALVVVESPEAS